MNNSLFSGKFLDFPRFGILHGVIFFHSKKIFLDMNLLRKIKQEEMKKNDFIIKK